MATTKINLSKELNKFSDDMEKVIKSTILEYMNAVLEQGLIGLPPSIASTYHLEVSNDGYTVLIYTDSDLAAWMEFGTGTRETVKTGTSAEEYLAGQPQEVSEEAAKFFVSGKGTMGAKPTFFPAWLRLKPEMVKEVQRRVDNLAKAF